MGKRAWAFAGGAGIGLAAGLWFARQYSQRHRTSLFAPRPEQRRAALRWLSRHGSTDSLRVLRDYLRWERNPSLRRKGETIVQRMERGLREAQA